MCMLGVQNSFSYSLSNSLQNLIRCWWEYNKLTKSECKLVQRCTCRNSGQAVKLLSMRTFSHLSAVRPDPIFLGILSILGGGIIASTLSCNCAKSDDYSIESDFQVSVVRFARPKNRLCIGPTTWKRTTSKYGSLSSSAYRAPFSLSILLRSVAVVVFCIFLHVFDLSKYCFQNLSSQVYFQRKLLEISFYTLNTLDWHLHPKTHIPF